jgi:hypothetical protein
MGGVGKTTISSWLVHQEACRSSFDKILWVPLGQHPNMDRAQDMMLQQLNATRFADEMTADQKKQDLKIAMAGQSVLLVLDDAWEPEHIAMLDVIDDMTRSKVLLSSRVRGLLLERADDVVDVGLPTEDEAVSMLLSTAGMKLATAPPEAQAIVKYCVSTQAVHSWINQAPECLLKDCV